MWGLSISWEGGEGSGKSSIVKLVEKYLESEGFDVMLTREPGGVKIAEQIRAVILDVNNTEMDPKTEAILYAASRREHIISKMMPALEKGKIVLCDRFIDSSLAYQGYARGLGIDEVYELNKFAIGEFMPDLTIYLDVDPEIGLQRIAINRDREVNRLDKESLDFHHKVREGYLEVVRRFPERIVMVDASKPLESVFEEIKSILDARLVR